MSPFNSYTIGLTLDPIKEHCIRHGELVKFARGETFEVAEQVAHNIGYVKKGCFKYIVRNESEGRDYITGFAFEGEFVADFPNCLTRQPAAVSIVAMTAAEVYVTESMTLTDFLDAESIGQIYKHLFQQIYTQYLDAYSHSIRERYRNLLSRCPMIVQQINLKDIASYLRVTPTTISKIRREITFGQ